MRCRDCPYGEEDFDRLSQYCDEEDIENSLWCDKVGGKVYCFGHCADFYEDDDKNISINCSKKKRRNKRERDLRYKNHVKYLAKTYPCYPPPAMPVDENGNWNFDDPVGTVYYKRTYRGNHKGNRYTYYKKYANRKVRRYKDTIANGCACKKVFDYWWTVD